MTKLGFYNFYDTFNNNRMFDPAAQADIGEDILYPTKYLYQLARKKGLEISTIDTEPLETYDAIFFLDYPGKNNSYLKRLIEMNFKELYLIIFENPIIKPDNWDERNYQPFKKVFTYNDAMIDNKKTFKSFLSNKLPDTVPTDITKKTKFCCMIAGNRKNIRKGELYSERVRAIKWFEKNQPDRFDLYGILWDFPYIPSFLRGLTPLFQPFYKYYPKPSSYKGTCKSKRVVLEQYKFSICYENLQGCPGYITEKIFDSFFAGCIPVYLGAPNITDYVPESTFIDKRNFSGYPELFQYMRDMSDMEYIEYLRAIESYVKSEKILPFGAEYFAQTILNTVEGNENGV